MSTSSRLNKLYEFISVGICLTLALYLRLLPYPVVITKNAINLFAQDPYYHARRIQLALSNHFIIPTYDSYSGFPQGLYCFWSNLYDYSILWVTYLIDKGHPTIRHLEIVTAFAPAIWGVISLLPAYLLIKRIFNQRIALLSILFMAFLPGHIYQTLLGRADHYGADAFFPLLMYYFILKGLNSGNKNTMHRYSMLSGICATMSWLTWPGATIFIGIEIVYLLIQSIFDYIEASFEKRSLQFGYLFLSYSLLTLFPFSATSYWGKHGILSSDAISWFQWVLLVIFIGYFLLIYIIQKYLNNHGYKVSFYIFSLLFTGLLGSIFTYFYFPELSNAFLSGLGWVGKTDPWLQTITEFQPLFVSIGVFSTFRATSFFTYGIYLLPIIYLVCFGYWIKVKNLTPEKIWFIIYTVIISLLGLYQTRFSHFFAMIVAVGMALLFINFWDKRDFLLNKFKRKSVIEPVYGLTGIILLYYLLSPSFQEIRAMPGKYSVIPHEWRETLEWIKENTPQTSYYDKPYRQPEYGILAPWIAGHWINYIAHRPTLANGFHTNKENNLAGMDFFLSENLHDAKSILEDKKIRYIILTDMTPNMNDYSHVIGKEDSDYIFKTVYHPPEGGTRISFQPTQKYYQLISSRLYMDDGLGLNSVTQGGFRLVYETPESWTVAGKDTHVIKVFEYVKGLILRGVGKSDSLIHLSVPIKTNTGRTFIYQMDTNVTSKGVYQLVLPYSQNDCPYETCATAPYSIQIGKKKYQISVDEKMITQGKPIILTE